MFWKIVFAFGVQVFLLVMWVTDRAADSYLLIGSLAAVVFDLWLMFESA